MVRRARLAVGGVIALLVTGFAAGRVFAPTDTLDRAHTPHPPAVTAQPKVYGELMQSPLLVGTRLRIYAGDNRVWADGPVDRRLPTSALWAFRRWPARLVGVVATDDVVVSKWSDGQLVALDPDQGRIAWRARGPVGVTSYQGRRTGARTVYDPPDLYLGETAAGHPVVVSTGTGSMSAFDAATGTRLWTQGVSGGGSCRVDFTAPAMVVAVDRCAGAGTIKAYDAATGRPRILPSGVRGDLRPVGCALGHSGCTGLAGPGGGWLIGGDGTFTAAAALSDPQSWLSGRVAMTGTPDGRIRARDAVTGATLWSWPDGGDGFGALIVAVEPGVVHLLTPDLDLVTVNVGNGGVTSRFAAHLEGEDQPWRPGYVYAAHGFVAVERLLPDGRPDRVDSAYYYPFPTVMLTGS